MAFRSKTRLLNHFGGSLLQQDCPEEQGLVFTETFSKAGNCTDANQAHIPLGLITVSLHKLTSLCLAADWGKEAKTRKKVSGFALPFPILKRAGLAAQPKALALPFLHHPLDTEKNVHPSGR